MARLQLKSVVKSYGIYEAVRGIDLDIEDNEFVVFVGPSGCGKSTTLRMIAGLEHITAGDIVIGDRVVTNLGPGKRDIAMVFQNYALYPHMSVRENIAFCLQQQKLAKPEIEARIRRASETLHITELLDRRPGQLSGGQRQRVAMGRAIVRNPKVFLFDEPLSNLDAKLRVQMRTEIKRLHQILPTTTVYVTHDQVEAMTMADRVVVMNAGLVEQVGPPQELYHSPASLFVAGFIGSPSMNFLEAELIDRDGVPAVRLADGTLLAIPAQRLAGYAPHVGKAVTFGIRPESISPRQEREGFASIDVMVDLVEPLGPSTMIYFDVANITLCASISPDSGARPQTTMPISVNMNQMHLFDRESGRSLRT
ncbi:MULTISPECIES: ABC transporter ATP-binding protein [Rhizobium]|uniref:Sn-glycerol-3-phosphate ABC transporter ATP-binding protein UgpC n=1 Tax=Rhizobium rhododendri TaxID=2506430 RepID=A0ABY8IQ85_9HYPH|nr:MULTISPECIES: sn-glycerol-3-phosphate ABC transporter ATP-binding protein UgpC [Rhizobium]MBO9134537.1 sn-glycerol-3-phosphate ABC transporter ATP-binding protein UgpC [Rhizobium sp. B209b/85]MBZ5762040.1 sn-glycerol-3-phosphate ABC transporter ATP-binding protein UgpC [Rhizobium sp. VS19-DR96]MBZ5768153.1 sn-glycerol-3-phosphate ABC transporter ATP-binding protein UgpC [Rhizobium sp. VS19-DR129.2]MBZ5775781.1 sn-glycerol-3-phosphate ABC transporter ATP-binding protein UgpC [Rhizobium sp. VS